MSELNGGQLAARQLKAAGVDTIFGVVAGPTIEVMAGAVEEGLTVIGCRHEENAGFMASAWGYVKRKPGVLVTGSGPGTTNAVTPLHVATESAMPLVVLGGSAPGMHRGLGAFQEADQVAFARPGCKWAQQVDSTERVPELLHLALGKSVAGRPGGVYLDFPAQVVGRKIDPEKAPLRGQPEIAAPQADPAAVERVADMLAEAQRPLIIVGKGAAWADARGPLQALVDRGIPYVCSPMARGTLPDDHPNFVNAARSAALKGADAILMVGGRFNWVFQFGGSARYAPDVRIAQIDVSAEEMYSAANLEIGLVADAAAATRQIGQALEGRELASRGGEWLDQLRQARDKNEASLLAAMESESVPLDPHRVVAEVRSVLPRDSSIAVDGETTMGIARQMLPSYTIRGRLNAGTTGCMGVGVPYAIGAKLARPEAPSVAVVGDYAFGAAAMAIETAARNGIPVVFVVVNNQGIAGHMIQDGMFPAGSPRVASLSGAHYEKMAEMVDGHAERVERPGEVGPAVERALASGKVALVHAIADPKATRMSGGVYLR